MLTESAPSADNGWVEHEAGDYATLLAEYDLSRGRVGLSRQ